MALSHNPRIVTDGLVLCLDAANPKSYPGSGTTWYDLSGNGNDGTLVNGVEFDSTNNGSFTFDGSNQYVNVSSFYDFSTTNRITAFAWVKSSASSWNDTGWILSKRNQFIIHPDSGSKNVDFYVNDGGWNKVEYAPNAVNIWNHYCLYYDQSNLKAFVNGEEVASMSLNTSLTSDSGSLAIGRDDGSSSRYGAGNISNVQIYNRALSASEIQQNFQALRGRYGI